MTRVISQMLTYVAVRVVITHVVSSDSGVGQVV